MMRYVVAAVVISLGMCPIAAGVASAAQETPIYAGSLKTAPVPMTIGAWGSGSLQEVSEVQFQGTNALKLTSQGDFQGGRIDFSTPLDISSYAGQPNAYIEMWVRPYYGRPQPTTTTAAGTETGAGVTRSPYGVQEGRTQLRTQAGGTGVTSGRATARTRGTFSFGGRSTQRGITGARTRGTYGQGAYGRGMTGRGAYGQGAYGRGTTGRGAYGQGAYGRGMTGRGTYGQGAYGRGMTGRGAYGAGAYGRGTSRRGTTGQRGYRAGAIGQRGYGASQYGARGYRTTRPKSEVTTTATVPVPTGPAPASEATFRTDAFRVQLTTDKGTAVLSDYPIYPGNRNASGWVRVGFPLRDFKGPLGDKLQRIAIFDERPDVLYIGQVRLLLDTTPVEARPTAYPAIAKVGQSVTFVADVTAGLAPAKVVWDFDNSNGIQEEVTGTRVANVYNQAGDYEATATVSDATGANPATKTYIVLVRVR